MLFLIGFSADLLEPNVHIFAGQKFSTVFTRVTTKVVGLGSGLALQKSSNDFPAPRFSPPFSVLFGVCSTQHCTPCGLSLWVYLLSWPLPSRTFSIGSGANLLLTTSRLNFAASR